MPSCVSTQVICYIIPICSLYHIETVFTREQKCAIWILIRIAQFEWAYTRSEIPSFEWSFKLRNSNYASRCNFAYTQSKILSFKWSFKLRNSNYASRCNFAYTWSKIQSFKWSFKLRNSNYALRCNFTYTRSKIPSFEWSFKLHIQIQIKIAHFCSCVNTVRVDARLAHDSNIDPMQYLKGIFAFRPPCTNFDEQTTTFTVSICLDVFYSSQFELPWICQCICRISF